jgi:elongation factor P
MKISAFEIRTGNLIEHNGKLWRVYKKQHVKPGKGGAFVQVEMKDISAGTKLNERFRSEDRVERAHVEARSMQYLYQEGDNHVFMDNQTYEQMSLTADELEGQLGFVLEVVETEGTVKGQTAAGSGKPARLETGLTVTVPTFVNGGDKVKVNTETGEYVERA